MVAYFLEDKAIILNSYKTMKRSRYNIFVPMKGFTIIYNSFSDKFVGLSCELVSLFRSSLEEFQCKRKKHYDRLVELGMIVPDEFDELSIIRKNYYEAIRQTKDLYVMIYPTQDCNLKCWYCYESHVPQSFMSKSVMNKVILSVQKKMEGNKLNSLLVGFFGGEPLTKFDELAYPLSLKLKELAIERKIPFSTFFVTNASLINEAMVKKLSDINPLFQITLDGTKEKHDTVRVYKKNNQGTYQTIINAIKLISSCIENHVSEDPVLTIRLNYDNQTLKNVERLISDLEGIDRSKILIHFERVWQTRHLVDDEQRLLLLKAIEKFVKAGFTIKHGVFKRKKVSCPSDTYDFMIVNYDGLLYKCNGRTLTPETNEGCLLEDGTIKWDQDKLDKRFCFKTFENEICLNCNMLPLCLGPCSQKLMEVGHYDHSICSLKSIDFSLEDYLKMEFEMRYVLQSSQKK